MLDREPTRAAEIARKRSFALLPQDVQDALTTEKAVAYNNLIADAMLSFKGPKSLAKPIRTLLPTLSSSLAVQYAAYAFGWSFEEASIKQLRQIGLTHKRSVASPECCDVCQANKDQGAIPLEACFQSGHMHAPFCERCRCATSGARAT